MNYPLWTPTNKTLFSNVFTVPPGKVCVLFADKLEPQKVRTDAAFRAPQAVCIRKVLYEFDASSGKSPLQCGWIFDIGKVKEDKIVDALVHTCRGPWQLTLCNNTGIIGVPGSYRLELNDSTAIGVAQVYAELYSVDDFPMQVQDLFFK